MWLCTSASVVGCNAVREVDTDPDDPSDPVHPGDPTKIVDNALGCRGKACSTAVPCASGQRCLEGVCVTAGESC
ncbi:MAG TPA: hypothetical protein PK493_11370, partial [Pseudomonadota bacterium]|nr:hypothetical protein [Pseudomonadota bacterium]